MIDDQHPQRDDRPPAMPGGLAADAMEECMGLAVDGSLAHLRRLLPAGTSGYVGAMNRWTGRYERSFRYVPHDVGWLLGRLWVLFAHTGDEEFRDLALRIIDPMVDDLTTTPIASLASGIDIYFGLCIGAEVTGSDRLLDWSLAATENLVSSLWDEEVGRFIPSRQFPTDEVPVEFGGCLYNVLWASTHVPSHLEHVERHQRALLTLGLVRDDGSTNHVARLDDDGTVARFETLQGWRPTSTWARGQSWAMHSFAMLASVTDKPATVEAADRLAGWWLDHLPPDGVPYYDFDDPNRTAGPRDSCAAAMAVSALLRQRPSSLPERRVAAAIDATLGELCANYLSAGGLLLHSSLGGVGEHLYGRPVSRLSPNSDRRPEVTRTRFPQEDVMAYGNYFIVETLHRRLRGRPAFPATAAEHRASEAVGS